MMNIAAIKTCSVEKKPDGCRSGVALLLTMVVLVVLTSIVYKLAAEISVKKHRQQYIIDYQKTRYACDSGMKYALSRVPKISLSLKEREDYPELLDFSDTFWMDREQYKELLFKWADHQANDEFDEYDEYGRSSYPESSVPTNPTGYWPEGEGFGDSNGMDMASLLANLRKSKGMDYYDDYLDPNDIKIPGPYQAEWPNIVEPIEFEIDNAKITITFEDENAKMPLVWATMTGDRESQEAAVESQEAAVESREAAIELREAAIASFETFCGWMNMDVEGDRYEQLWTEIEELGKHKEFKLAYNPPSRQRKTSAPVKKPVKKARAPEAHAADFAKLIHSSIIDLEMLATPMYDDDGRDESIRKYLGLWGAAKVNINTAPRHVLEAAFTFGGESEDIAAEIIRLRREKPFTNSEDIKERMYGFNDSIQKALPYITFNSEIISIKVVATSGKAKSTYIAAVRKVGKSIKKIASFSY